MNNNNFVEFKKERDLGAIITDTFKFIRLEWKPFFSTVIKISIIPILLAIITIIFYSAWFSNIFTGIFSSIGGEFGADVFDITTFMVLLLALIIFSLVAYALVSVSSLSYIKSYINNRGRVNLEEVKDITKRKFGAFIGLYFLNGLIIGIGAMFCGIPGIYFWVVLSLTYALLIFENKGVFDSINDAFNFIKGHWWDTFGILLVIFLLTIVMDYVSQIPVFIYQLVDMGISLGSEDPTEVFDILSDPIYLVLLFFSYFINFLIYMVTLITSVFIYFDINEQKYASGSIDMIDNLGS